MVLLDVVVDVLAERVLRVAQFDTVLRTLRAGDRGHHRGQVEFEVLGELRLVIRPLRIGIVPHALCLGVGLHQSQLLLGASGQPQILDGLFIDREHRCGGTEFGAHIAQRGAVGQRHLGHALAVELDELADHTVLAQHVGDGQHHVGGGDAGLDLTGQFEADDAGDQHRHRLAQHGRLGLDTAHTPAQHAQAVLHGGVTVGADAGVGVCDAVAFHHHARQIFDVDLVDDAGPGRHHLEVVERSLAPAQELVALAIALIFEFDIALEGAGVAEEIEDHRVVDDHLGGGERVDLVGVAAESGDSLSHGGQVDDAGHAGEVLHQDAGRRELDLDARLSRGIPVGDRADVVGGDIGAVLGTQQVLGEHLQAVGQFLSSGYRIEAIDLVTVVPDGQGVAGSERIEGRTGRNAAHIDSRRRLSRQRALGWRARRIVTGTNVLLETGPRGL